MACVSNQLSLLSAVILCLVINMSSAFYQKIDGVITTTSNKRVFPGSDNGDYEFVLSGASDGGDNTALVDRPLDRQLMEGQGFTLLGVEGSKDRKSEIWVRQNSGQSSIDISGNANDVAYCVLTIYKENFNFDINQDIVSVTQDSTHGSSSVSLRLPSQDGLKIAGIFFDDPMEVTDARGGHKLSARYSFGDEDGFAAVMYEPSSYPPTSLPIRRDSAGGGSQYVSVGISINARNIGQNQGMVLGTNEKLIAGQFLESENKQYRCYFQGDGNLVLRNSNGVSQWSTGSHGKGGSHVKMQSDGNLVIYTSSGTAVWSSKTQGQGGVKFVIKGYGKMKIEASDGSDIVVYP